MYKCISLIFILLTVIIATIISVIGCGGNDNNVSPNISTPTPDPLKTAYITVDVQWPSRGEEGKYTISSSKGQELTASMTKDTKGIKFFVYDYSNQNVTSNQVIGQSSIAYPNTSTTIAVYLDDDEISAANKEDDPNTNLLPPIPVKISVEAYSTVTSSNPPVYTDFISKTEKEYTIQLGDNHINLNLGDYTLTVSVNPSTIYPPAYKSISSNYGIAYESMGKTDTGWSDISKIGGLTIPLRTPTPYTTPPTGTPAPPTSALITANLRLVYPPDTDQNGTPLPTQTPKPVAGKTIRFTVVSGDGVLDSYTAVTDENGNCSVKLLSGKSDLISVKADFQADINDPNSIYSATCFVYVKYKYSLTLKS